MSQIVKEIVNQLGSKAIYMMGVKQLLSDGDALVFKIRGSKQYNWIRIELNVMDTYDIKFSKVRQLETVRSLTKTGIYNDMLHKTIEENTGLYLSL